MVDIKLEPVSGRFAPHDDRWLSQVAELIIALNRATGTDVRRETPVPGTKGTVTEIIVSLGSANVFIAVRDVIKAWLGRDSSRSAKVSFYPDGTPKEIDLKGYAMSFEELQRLIGNDRPSIDPPSA
jgi:hypothetical protein